MAKRHHVQKLLAVMVMASAPAAAGPEHAHHAPPPAKPAGAPAKTDAKLAAAPAVQPDATPVARPGARPATHAQAELARVLAVFGITLPRRLATGAPACGNVMSKGPRHCDEDAQ
jgi:hypothetical protein